LQVGLPIAAGALLPVTGTILTPSIDGALMGFSLVGVMANSLLLKVRLNSSQQLISYPETRREPHKTISDALSDSIDEAVGTEKLFVETEYLTEWFK
jgi:P-type Cu+ transporter